MEHVRPILQVIAATLVVVFNLFSIVVFVLTAGYGVDHNSLGIASVSTLGFLYACWLFVTNVNNLNKFND